MIALPVTEDPVNVTRSTRSSAVSDEPAGAPCPLSTLSTPGGKPASMARRPSRVTDAGVSSLGLMMHVLPHAIAGAIFQVAIMSGKFHGRDRRHDAGRPELAVGVVAGVHRVGLADAVALVVGEEPEVRHRAGDVVLGLGERLAHVRRVEAWRARRRAPP